jgi:hypothetical protein
MSKQSYTYCTITSNRPIGKVFTPDLKKSTLPIFEGRVEVDVGTIEQICTDIEAMSSNQCLTAGIPRVDDAVLTTRKKEVAGRKNRDGLPIIARTNDNWHWPAEPGLLAFDHDPEHWNYEPLTSVEAVVAKIGEALKVDMGGFDYVAMPSSSSNIWLGDQAVVGLKGVHVYVGVTSLADIDGDALMNLAFQNGLGCGVVSASGSILKRTVFDSALHKAASQPVFAASPTFEGEHESRREIICNAGRPLDLKSVQGLVQPAQASAAWDAVKMRLGGQAKVVFEKYVADREAQGLTRDAVDAAVAGELPGSWPVVFNDGTIVKVWEMMAAPLTYNERSDVRDPLEPEYGESKAKIWIDAGVVTIHSQAHGGRTYRCFGDLASLRDNPALKTDWPRLVGELGVGVKPAEIVDALKEAGLTESKQVLNDRVKRIIRQASVSRAKAQGDKWASQYAFLETGGRFLSIPTLEIHKQISTIGVQAFNITQSKHPGPSGEKPAEWLVGNAKVIPSYERIIYSPPEMLGGALPFVERALNAWRPGPALRPTTASPTLWLQLLEHMLPDDDERENLIDWLAYAVQYPGRKCNWQVLICSQEGMGKDTMLWPVRYAVGMHNARDVTTDELLERFEHYLVGGPKLLVLQELDAAKKTAMRNKLKPLAAAPPAVHTVEAKNEKPVYVDNFQAVMTFTNAVNPVSLDKGDRRHYMLRSPNIPWPTGRFKALWEWYHAGGIEQVARWLVGRDLSAFDPDVLPAETQYKRNVIEMSMTSYHMVVEDILAGKEVVTVEYVVRMAALAEERITRKQAQVALSEMQWEPYKANRKIEGKVKSMRVWRRFDCRYGAAELYDMASKLITY